MSRKAKTVSPYSVHPSIQMVVNWVASLKDKTGKSLEEWIDLIRDHGQGTETEQRNWLKSDYQLGTNTAAWLVDRAAGRGEEDTPEGYLKIAPHYVDAMFAGKESLRPIFEALMKLARALGNDVKFCPCKTIVPFYRHHVFAQVKPATQKRIDFGLALRDTPPTGRLIDTGGSKKKDRITHKIAISSVEEIDEEVIDWLRMAYDRDVK